ncbi:Nucleolar protein 56 [Phytophthora nicotianae]|uniref:Nucleolar protein 56 n=1 Tax=Phytophthora nicotianae TaxID=4792 RepID=A0A0W8BY89_PHYNI|nr:Nucleolar protein 56 [Phytophthora nicotianae]
MGANNFVLFESASGYAIFEVVENEEIGGLLAEVQASVADVSSFGRIVKLKAFQPFTSAENALENINNVSEGLLSEDLKNFLEMNLPKVKSGKKAKFALGVQDKGLAQAISDELNAPCNTSETTLEIVRGVRMHFATFVKELAQGNLAKAQLGLGHSYSRAKVKFNVNRADNMIIQAIALLDQMDKDINTFAMRVREWYSWHFPELVKIVNDNYVYARCASFIKNRSSLSEDSLEELAKIVLDEDKAQQILHAARSSMGMDMSEIDMINVDNFTTRLVKLAEYRRQLHEYLVSKMSTVAPNLASLIGESVGARLISHAGSLTNLAKCPASTVQILGAEKALFRALKTRGNTPKYGLLFHSTFIGRAAAKNKGRISRYLANKCAIASRIDSFIDEPTTKYGDKMREQVEERLAFYESGAAPRKNADVMQEVSEELKKAAVKTEKKSKKDKKSKKRPAEDEDVDMEEVKEEIKEETPVKKSKKDKKHKKQKKAEEEETTTPAVDADKKKKKKHKKKSKTAE